MIAGALVRLTLWQAKNRIRVRLARLREPRYLVGSIAGLAYLGYFVVLRNPAFSARRGSAGMIGLERFAGPLELIVAVVLLILATLVWLLPASAHPIRFSPSEVQFLFPAPITRRQLLQYRLWRAQLGLLIGSAMSVLFMRPTSLANGWRFLTGIWLILMTSRIYFIGVSLYREGLRQRGISGLARWAPVAVMCGAVATVAIVVGREWSSLAALSSSPERFDALGRMASSGALWLILWPFRALSHVLLAGTTTAYLVALPGALLILIVNYLWVLRADTAFEESAALIAEKRLDSRWAARSPPRVVVATPFTLAPTGRAEAAIVWKNLIMVGRYLSLKTLVRVAPMIVAMGIAVTMASREGGLASVFALLCMALLGTTVLFGPIVSRNDLRRDLGHLAMLKAWPISGATLLRGEILAPAVLLTAIAWLSILGATVLVPNLREASVAAWVLNRFSYATAALMIAPAVILAELTVLNGLAVVFPAWIATGATRSRGVEAMGQRMFTMAGVLIALVIALIPAALAAAAVAGPIYLASGVILVVLPAAIVLCVVVVECLMAVAALGRVLDRTDVSAVSP